MKLNCLLGNVGAVLVLGVLASFARANGGIAAGTLDEMGLGGMAIMSDEDALVVRGFGYSTSVAGVYGHSWASVRAKGASAGSQNGYKASGRHFAVGSNLSFAKIEIAKPGSHGPKGGNWGSKKNSHGGGHGGGKPQIRSIKAVAGGHSFAKTK